MAPAPTAPLQRAPLLRLGQDGAGSSTRIINATSGSSASQRATAVAAAIAAEHGGELVVVHVLPPREVRVVRLGATVARPCWLKDPYSEPVLLQARRLAWANGIGARVGLIAGLPADGIVMAARELGAELVVIGGRRRRLPAWPAAPTRARVQRRCSMPVLAVPPDLSPGCAVGGPGGALALVEVLRC